jgi:hypothetical protein
MDYAPTTSDLESSFDVLTEQSTYAGAMGLVAGAFIGGLLTYLPFYRLGRAADIGSTVVTALGGGYLIVNSRSRPDSTGKAMNYAGTVLILSSVVQVAGMVSPRFGSMLGRYSAEDLPQSGSGSVIGQETATRSYSDIKNAEEWDFEESTVRMQERGMDGLTLSSVEELAPLGHGVDQNFGSEQIYATPTGGVDQDFGGPMIESSTVSNPTEMALGDYVSSVDTMGKGAMAGFTGLNPLTMTNYSMDTPPVMARTDEPTMSMGTPDPKVQEVSPYFKPPTTADNGEAYILGSHTVVNAGQPMQFYGAEGKYSTTIGNHVRGAEGNGSIFGM